MRLLICKDSGAEARRVPRVYYAPERMTDGTWNLYLLAVHPDRQGRGRGASLVRYVEQDLRTRGARLLIIETSGLPGFARQREFYTGLGYQEEARIREFYSHGDDKVIYWKALAAPNLCPCEAR